MRTRLASVTLPLSAALALVACGDNNDGDGTPIDGPRVDAAAVDGSVTDAPAIDAPAIDASDIDAAMIDAAMIDAAMIDAAAIDAADIDAAMIDAPAIDAGTGTDGPPPVAVGTHLLLTEVKTFDGSEFIEIYNPTAATIDLRNYYLTDHNAYPQYPGYVAGNVTVTQVASDFLARFPAGATIAPRQVIVVATDAVMFEAGFAQVPTYTVQELGNSTAMELIWASAMSPNPGLTNDGEMVALFFWDGATDTVKDVDIFLAGNAPSAGNTIAAKPAVDGPDADTMTTAYATDALTLQDMATDTPTLTSYKRIALESAATETQSGTGNGITGDDETSEQSRTTWDSQAMASGYTAGTPGTVPAALNP